MRSQSASVGAMGFSQMTCFPPRALDGAFGVQRREQRNGDLRIGQQFLRAGMGQYR